MLCAIMTLFIEVACFALGGVCAGLNHLKMPRMMNQFGHLNSIRASSAEEIPNSPRSPSRCLLFSLMVYIIKPKHAFIALYNATYPIQQ